jgi:S-formylglutathione hydrolase FrmB
MKHRHIQRNRRGLLLALLLWTVSVFLVTAPVGVAAADTPSPSCIARTAPIPQGPATFVGQIPVSGYSGRLLDVTLYSPALAAQTHVYVLLPVGYDPSGKTRYPTLYLIHGAAGSYLDWINSGNAQQIIDQTSQLNKLPPFITVMPDAGVWGFYSDWYGSDLDGMPNPPPAWTTYHIGELIPWIDGHYPTKATRSNRAIAGLSMGGFGAISYAARFPNLFVSAGTFSGAVDNDLYYPYGPTYLSALAPVFSGGQFNQCVWGDEITQDVHWRGNNPTYLADSLAYTDIYITVGGGDTPTTIANDPIEQTCYYMSKSLVAALDSRGIKHTDDFYGGGSHAWSYWQADLQRYLPLMAQAFAHPPSTPPSGPFSHRSILPSFAAWGWTFTTDHQVTEFTYLTDVSQYGLFVMGSGTLQVITAALYPPGSRWTVTQEGGAPGVITASHSGQLAFPVYLGPPHTAEQSSFDTGNETTGWPQATVSIRRAK